MAGGRQSLPMLLVPPAQPPCWWPVSTLDSIEARLHVGPVSTLDSRCIWNRVCQYPVACIWNRVCQYPVRNFMGFMRLGQVRRKNLFQVFVEIDCICKQIPADGQLKQRLFDLLQSSRCCLHLWSCKEVKKSTLAFRFSTNPTTENLPDSAPDSFAAVLRFQGRRSQSPHKRTREAPPSRPPLRRPCMQCK